MNVFSTSIERLYDDISIVAISLRHNTLIFSREIQGILKKYYFSENYYRRLDFDYDLQ